MRQFIRWIPIGIAAKVERLALGGLRIDLDPGDLFLDHAVPIALGVRFVFALAFLFFLVGTAKLFLGQRGLAIGAHAGLLFHNATNGSRAPRLVEAVGPVGP